MIYGILDMTSSVLQILYTQASANQSVLIGGLSSIHSVGLNACGLYEGE